MVDDGSNATGTGSRNRYHRDYRPPERGHFGDHGNHAPEAPQLTLSVLEKRVATIQQDFKQALHKVSGKDNEKFDLIFAILSELQSRQAQLEETVRSLKAQCCNLPAGPGPCSPQHGQQQMGGAQQSYAPMAGQMHGGGQAVFTPVQQVLVVSSPTGGMQQMEGYGMPQLMSPTGAMQPMPQQMALQFMGPAQGPDFSWGAEGGSPLVPCMATGGENPEAAACNSGQE